MVVPLQMSLIPLLRMYNDIGAFFGVSGKSYPGIWLAHTGFGLPLAIYLLRNYMGTLPKEIIESARIDGANHFQIFTRLVVPLSVPALASFTILQFLWVWNDLLVALVFSARAMTRSYSPQRCVNSWDPVVTTGKSSPAVPSFPLLFR